MSNALWRFEDFTDKFEKNKIKVERKQMKKDSLMLKGKKESWRNEDQSNKKIWNDKET